VIVIVVVMAVTHVPWLPKIDKGMTWSISRE
jgi:hypothetical protein